MADPNQKLRLRFEETGEEREVTVGELKYDSKLTAKSIDTRPLPEGEPWESMGK